MKADWGGASGKGLGAAPPAALKALRTAFEPRSDKEALASTP